MSDKKMGCGVLFYDEGKNRVLFFLRDNKPNIRFPNMIDLIGGHIEEGESPDEGVVREIAEEITDRRTGKPLVIQDLKIFKIYTDPWGLEQHIYSAKADFEIPDLELHEGKNLLWLTGEEAEKTDFAYEFGGVVNEFFKSKNK